MNDRLKVQQVSHDEAMETAQNQARSTFRYFWKEVATDFNRIVPALSVAIVKCGFPVDDPDAPVGTEQMWVDNIFFDGASVSGELINDPQFVPTLSVGDAVQVPKAGISDWLCQIDEKLYGGYTVQVLRAGMSESERAEHDDAWGLPFPEPSTVNIPNPPSTFDENLAEEMLTYLKENPDALQTVDEDGRTLLHLEVLFGRMPGAKALLDLGLNVNARCHRHWTPLRYSDEIGWEELSLFLRGAGGER